MRRAGLRHVSAVLDDYFARQCRHCKGSAMPGWRCCRPCWNRIVAGELVANTGVCVFAGTLGEQLELWGEAA